MTDTIQPCSVWENPPKLRFFGHRLLYLKKCDDFSQTWEDIPEHFGRYFPSTLCLPRSTVSGPKEGRWFSRQLEEILAGTPRALQITKNFPGIPKSSVMFLNCLDPVFGHALYKLAAARSLLGSMENVDIVPLISKQLYFYASAFDGTIVIEESLPNLLIPNTNLMDVVLEFASSYTEYSWAMTNASRLGEQSILPSPEFSRLARNPEKPIITYIHRDDRTWGLGILFQTLRVNKCFRLLKRNVVGAETAVIGLSAKKIKYKADYCYLFPSGSYEYEKLLLNLCSKSSCIFGVHGSHMLVPSYFSHSTVELQPYKRLGNAVQAYWPNPERHIQEILFCYRVIYGGKGLWNISSSMVAMIIASIVMGIDDFHERMNSKLIVAHYATPARPS